LEFRGQMVLVFIGIRRCIMRRLILFFLLPLYAGCSHQSSEVVVIWEGDRAEALSIPYQYFEGHPDDSIPYLLQVYLLQENDQQAIFGEHSFSKGSVIFRPLIPFTRGLTYEAIISIRDSVRFTIPVLDQNSGPDFLAVYPTQDSLPDNLLKIYLKFSKPMRVGQSLKYIDILKNGVDTIPDVFLDLQPELWNYDGTMLTLWLDPGRIKRVLQPNRKLGVPLERESAYQLVISADWIDTQGATLRQSYTKQFFVIQRDSLSPDPLKWTINAPEGGTRNPLRVNFHESLDYTLALEAIHIIDAAGSPVPGTTVLEDEESVYQFTPEGSWSRGSYFLKCEARLEDLVGNNLNRPFDHDLVGKEISARKDIFSRSFEIP